MEVKSTHGETCACGHTVIFYGDALETETGETYPPLAFIEKMNRHHPYEHVTRVAVSTVEAMACPQCGRPVPVPVPELLDADRGGMWSA